MLFMTFMKMSYKVEQRLRIVQMFYENTLSLKNVNKTLHIIYGEHNRANNQNRHCLVGIMTMWCNLSTFFENIVGEAVIVNTIWYR